MLDGIFCFFFGSKYSQFFNVWFSLKFKFETLAFKGFFQAN